MFTSIFKPLETLTSFISSYSTSEESFVPLKEEKLDVEEALVRAKSWPKISKRQFAMRFLASYLDNTSIEGSHSEKSAAYWCHFIELWLSEEGVFLPFKINPSTLIELRDVLRDYGLSLDSHRSSALSTTEIAESTLLDIKKQLSTRGYAYTGLGYQGGPLNNGHAIPLRIDKKGSSITVHFLNLGEGVQLHPELEWDESYIRYHFRSFPIIFSEKEFFGEKGVELFARQITLMTQPASGHDTGYSAHDVYGAFCLVGKVEGSFSTNVSLRSKKPQIGPTCADKAIELVIRDFLIEKGAPKREIQRFFGNEKICSLLCFSHALSESKDLDEWTMFKKALQVFAITALKKNEKAFKEKEVQFCRDLINRLLMFAKEGKKRADTPALITPNWVECGKVSTSFDPIKETAFETEDAKDPEWYLTHPVDLPKFEETCPLPKMCGSWLKGALGLLETLDETHQRRRGFYFLSRITSQLPIPSLEADYWNAIPKEDIPKILEMLCQLIELNLNFPTPVCRQMHFHLKVILAHTCYAISDKLMRRIYPELKGFASPMAPLIRKNYQFPALLMGKENARWKEICTYFQQISDEHPQVLFGFHSFDECLDLRSGLKKLKRNPKTKDPTACHLKFLAQFLKKEEVYEDLALQYARLWENKGFKFLPTTFYHFQYLAHTSWLQYTSIYGEPLSLTKSLIKVEHASTDLWISFGSGYLGGLNDHMARSSISHYLFRATSSSYATILDKAREKTGSENKAMCLETSTFLREEEEVSLSTKAFRDLVRISAHPSLQITSTIQWALDHLPLMQEELVQDQIEKMLCVPNAQLIKRLAEAPHLIPRLHLLIEEGLKMYGSHPKNFPQMLFFIRLGIVLETHIQQTGISSDPSQFGKCETFLLSKISKEKGSKALYALYEHLRFLYSVALPNKKQSLKEMVKAGYWLKFKQDPHSWKDRVAYTPNWVTQEIQHLEDKWNTYLEELDPEEIDKLCQEIFQLILPSASAPTKTWKGTYPHYTSGTYTFHLRQNILMRNGTEQLWLFDPMIFYSEHMDELPQEFHHLFEKSDYLFWIGKEGYDSYNGEYRIHIEPKGEKAAVNVSLCKQITTEAGTHWYRKVNSSHSLVKALRKPDHLVWERVDEKGELIITEKKTGVPKYLIKQDEEKVIVLKLGPRGKILPYKLINTQSTDTSFFTRLGLKPEEALCWMDSSHQIGFLEIPRLNLQFQLNETNGMLQSLNYPDFFISKTQTLPELGHFKGALVLENELEEKRVLIASQTFKRNDEDFTTEVTMDTSSLNHTKVPYFVYTVDETSGMLLSEESEANLQLVMLFASMRDYTTAFSYLEHGKSYCYLSDFFENFTKMKDRSPEALAFNLRVGQYLFNNHSQVLKEGYGSRGSTLTYTIFYDWLANCFTQYLRFATNEHSRIPAYIRLTPEEELSLLTQLETIQTKTLPHLLNTRKKLLKAKKLVHAVHPSNYKLPISLPQVDIEKAFRHFESSDFVSCGPFNPNFVRMTPWEIIAHFPKLYQRALEGRGELDILYLSRSAWGYDKDERNLILGCCNLLFLIQTYPSAFEGLSFKRNAETHPNTLYQIYSLGSTLQRKSKVKAISEVYKKSVFFDYSAKKVLSLPLARTVKPLLWEFESKTRSELVLFHQSLQTEFLEELVTIKTVPAITDSRSFIFEGFPETVTRSPSLERLLKTYQKGFLESTSTKAGRDVFMLKSEVELSSCLKSTETLLIKKKRDLEKLRETIEGKANRIPEELIALGLRKIGKNLPKITVEGILTDALDAEDPNLISAANPVLSICTIQELLLQTMHYHILSCHITQLTKGIKALKESEDIQAFGEALAVYGAFDPIAHPELLVFQSRTKMIARKEQGAFITWFLQAPLDGKTYSTLLFEFEAGGGKGTFFTPIIKKQARKKGLLPISTSPATLYQVERKKQRASLKRAYKLNMEVLEIALNTKATSKDFKWIYKKLLEYSEKDALKIIPEVYYALDLKYQLALDSEDVKQVKYLSLILHLFEEKCAGFIDEGRLNLSPFTQAKIGIGKKASLPEYDHKLFIHLYRVLTSSTYRLKDGRRICDVVQLGENKQAMMSSKDAELVRQFLIVHMSEDYLLRIPETEKRAIRNWWFNPENEKPKWLIKQEKSKTDQARLIVEAAEYFHNFYSFALQTVGQMRHICSIKPGEEIDVPARQRKPTRAYFEEPYIALIFTIQGTLQRGLTQEQCAKLIDLLQETRAIERSSTRHPPIETKFSSWVENEKIQLTELSSKNPSDVELVHKVLSKNPEAIFWYLEKAVLHQVNYSTEQLIVTPQHFLNAFKMCTVYSAVLGPTEAYGFYPSEKVKDQLLKQNAAFAAHVVHQLTSKENQQMLKLDSFSSPLEFFKTVWKTHKPLFTDLRMLIDVGGMLRDFGTEEIASAFFDFMRELEGEAPEFDGIVLFQDSAGKAEESDLMIWLKGWEKPIVLPEGDVVSGLSALGYKWDELKLLTLIDPSHATGSDILQEEEATALLLLGENLSIGDLIQGVMRLRGFLKKQTIIWGILNTLAAKIEEELKLPCSAETVLFWALNNEAEIQEKEILLSAYQQIDYIVQKPARAYLKKHRMNPEKQIKVWKELRKGFVKPYVNDPLVRFGSSTSLEKTFSVLADYAKEEYERYGYPTAWEDAKELHTELKIVLKAAAAKIEKIPTKPLNELGRETHLQCHQHQHLKKEQEKLTYSDLSPEKSPSLEDKVHLYQPGFVTYLTQESFASPASKIFGSKYLSENLYYSNRLIHTAKSSSTSLGHTYLKPTQYLLVIYELDALKVIAISDEEAAFFQEQLIEGEAWLTNHKQKKSKVSRNVALFTADGFLAQNGPKELAFSKSQLEKLTTEHEWFKGVISDVGLLGCQMRDLTTFVSRAEKWKDLPMLWGQIKLWQTNPESLNTHMIDGAVKKASEEKSFLRSWF